MPLCFNSGPASKVIQKSIDKFSFSSKIRFSRSLFRNIQGKMAGKYKIVMVRHGESEWNQKNLFCGWFDANLSDKGKVRANCLFFFCRHKKITDCVIIFIDLQNIALLQARKRPKQLVRLSKMQDSSLMLPTLRFLLVLKLH